MLGPQEFIAYTEDIACLFETHETEYHLYADDIQTVAHAYPTDIAPAVDRSQQCIEAVRQWCIPRRLQLNPVKTEAIWFGTKAGLKKLNGADVNLHVANVTIQPMSVVRYLGVWLDSELSMKTHINKTVRICFYQLRRLKQVRRIIDQKTAANLVTSLVLTRLDYCNAVYAGLPKSTTSSLQRVQNAAARLVAGNGPRDHITPVLHSLYWLPVDFGITFKLCPLMHLVPSGSHWPQSIVSQKN